MNDESGQSRHILVIDDDVAMRQMIVNYLEENYMHAVPCSGGGIWFVNSRGRNPAW